ncbi:MAG: DUF2267 domain-containing protein [Actinobacteria bacterium]|nr:DUF2267 domain-containing protein [Actinomycetota bacterium]
MKHDEFIGLVQSRARLDSRGAAESATRATLTTLAERLGGGLPSNLGAQLPPEIGRHLEDGDGERFDIGDFWDRVAEREVHVVETPEAAFHARAVMSVVAEAVGGDQLQRIQDQLTPEWSDLFDFSFVEDAAGT